MRAVALAAALVAAGCGRSGLVDDGVDAGTFAPALGVADAGARAEPCSPKVRFEQATGCQNDGAVELCATDDVAAYERLARIAPGLIRVGTPGRTGCTAPDTAYLLPLEPLEDWCVEKHGALTASGWAVVCTLAAQPEVSALGPFWAE